MNGYEVSPAFYLTPFSSLLSHKSSTNPFPMPFCPHAGPSGSVHSSPSITPRFDGGRELALICDIIIASPTTTFGQPNHRRHSASRTPSACASAKERGIVSHVVSESEDEVVKEAVAIAGKVAIVVAAGKR